MNSFSDRNAIYNVEIALPINSLLIDFGRIVVDDVGLRQLLRLSM